MNICVKKKKQTQAQLYMIRTCMYRGRKKRRKVKFLIGPIGVSTRNHRVYSEGVVAQAIQRLDQRLIPITYIDIGLDFDILELAEKLHQQFPNWKYGDSSHPQ